MQARPPRPGVTAAGRTRIGNRELPEPDDVLRRLVRSVAWHMCARGSSVTLLDISVTHGESGLVVVLAGEADLTNAGELKRVLDKQTCADAPILTVDLSQLRFADSAAITALALAGRTLRDQGRQLELLHPQPTVARILSLTGLDKILTVRCEPAAGSRSAPECPQS